MDFELTHRSTEFARPSSVLCVGWDEKKKKCGVILLYLLVIGIAFFPPSTAEGNTFEVWIDQKQSTLLRKPTKESFYIYGVS